MPWLEICVTVDREDAAAAEEALQMLGAISVTLEDEADRPVLEPERGTTPCHSHRCAPALWGSS